MTSLAPGDDPIERFPSRDLFGHPRGLTFLFLSEMWERFSYYGMRALLVLYMTKYLFEADQDVVLGHRAVRRVLASLFGPLDVQPLASHIYGFYTGLVYLTPIFGGLLADRVLGRRRTVVVGAALMAIGHFMMAIEALFFVALLMLILGSGAFKPNISAQVGGLYRPGDVRRDRAYSVFYVGINLGAFLAPLVCGTLGERLGWHYGFAAAGIGMLIGLAIYLAASPALPADETRRAATLPAQPLERGEWRVVAALLALFAPVTLFSAAYEQQGNTIPLWADRFADRHVELLFWRGEIPTTWFQALNPLLIFTLTPLILALWTRQAHRGTEPSTTAKIALGTLAVAAANLLMALAAWHGGAGKASWLWLVAYFVVITVGELYVVPVGLLLVFKAAPTSVLSLMMGLWFATAFIGNIIGGWLGTFWSSMDRVGFFVMMAAIAAAASAMIFAHPLRQMIDRDRSPLPHDA